MIPHKVLSHGVTYRGATYRTPSELEPVVFIESDFQFLLERHGLIGYDLVY
jgi:hypothetical protein